MCNFDACLTKTDTKPFHLTATNAYNRLSKKSKPDITTLVAIFGCYAPLAYIEIISQLKDCSNFHVYLDMVNLIQNKLDEIIEACKKHHVVALALFGSAARDSMTKESDIDLLVDFSNEIDVLDYADNYFSLLNELQAITDRKVDLVSIKSLKNPILKEEVNQSKVDLYAA